MALGGRVAVSHAHILFSSKAPGNKRIDDDERGSVYRGYHEGRSPLLAACAGRAEVTPVALY